LPRFKSLGRSGSRESRPGGSGWGLRAIPGGSGCGLSEGSGSLIVIFIEHLFAIISGSDAVSDAALETRTAILTMP
jgi:hypothetical protein